MIKNKRQVSPTLEGIRDDHVKRYEFAAIQCMNHDITGPVLDIGCGCGYGSYILAQSGLNVYGVDVDPDAVEYGRAHYSHKRIQRWAGGMDDIALEFVQAIVAFEVIEHSKDAPAFLRRAARAGVGVLIGSVPNDEVVPFGGPNIHPQHYRHYTPKELSFELLEAGWNVVFIGSQAGKRGQQARIDPHSHGRTLVFVAVPA